MRAHGGSAPSNAIDFSAPLNPLEPPSFVFRALEIVSRDRLWMRYPSYTHEEGKEVVAEYVGVERDRVVLLNGASEAYTLIPLALRVEKIVIVEPTFGDRDIEALANELSIDIVRVAIELDKGYAKLDIAKLIDVARKLSSSYRTMLLLSNPNNPTTMYMRSDKLYEVVQELKHVYIVVDEAFIDFATDDTLARVEEDNLIVLRSFTKILSIPGIRLGYLVASRKLAKLFDNVRPPWNVNAYAYTVLTILRNYIDEFRCFINESRTYIATELNSIVPKLKQLDLEVYSFTTVPYILVKHPIPHPDMQQRLLERGVYVRDCSSFYALSPYFSRVSIRSRDENEVLVKAFKYALKH